MKLSIISQEYLILLKSKACLDLCKLKSSGKIIDSKNIKKHKNDAFRLYQILFLNTDIVLPQSIADDIRIFLEKISDEPLDLKNLRIRNALFAEIINLSQPDSHIILFYFVDEERNNEKI